MATKRKTATAVVASVAAVALLLGGTFAWTSISQQAKNEATGIVNVGGRLHDDFDGKNKDVYVENFTDGINGGQPIYARIKLTEYMEVGKEAGKVGADGQYDPDRNAASVIAGADINDPETWSIHKPASDCAVCVENGTTCVFHSHWRWEMGGQTTFMPTFNKDKDSLDADINGTYHGTDATDKIYYDDYVEYTTDANSTDKVYSETGTAYYDNDPDMAKNEYDGQYTTKEETHYAKTTADATVITMAEWKAAGSQPGPYWVYDTDGWAYWANPIMPGEATGLLLSGIDMFQNPGEKCYYAINVVGQFATVGDWEQFGVNKEDEDYPSEDALNLLTTASRNVPTVTVTNNNGKTLVMRGESVTFSATTAVGAASAVADDEYEWVVLDENRNPVTTSTIVNHGDGTATLTVGSEEMNAGLYVAARSKNHGAVGLSAVAVQLYTVTITEEKGNSVVIAGNTLKFSASVVESNTGNTVTSGVNWSLKGAKADTTIDSNGVLTVHKDEPGATVLTVTATSVNGNFIAEYKVTVADKYGVTVSASTAYVDPGKTLSFQAVVMKNGVEDTTSGVNWSVEGGKGSTKIDENGVLTVDASEVGGTELTITATSKTDKTAKGTCTVTVSKYEVSVFTENNATKVDAGKTLQFIAAVTKNDAGDNSGVTWTVTEAEGVSISDSGLLSVSTSVMDGTQLTVTATSTVDGKVNDTYTVTVNAEYALTIIQRDASIKPGDTIQYSATFSVNGIVTDANPSVTWKVTDASGKEVSNAIMEEDGKLTVSDTTYGASNLKITAVHNSTKVTDSTTATVNYTLTLNTTGTFTLDGLRVNVKESYYTASDISGWVSSGSDRFACTVESDSSGVYLLIKHYYGKGYTCAGKVNSGTVSASVSGGPSASLGFSCVCHQLTITPAGNITSINFNNTNRESGIQFTVSNNGTTIDPQYIDFSCWNDNAEQTDTYVTDAGKLMLGDDETGSTITVYAITEIGYAQIELPVHYIEMRLYNNNSFNSVLGRVYNGDSKDTVLANYYTTQIRIYDMDGNHIKNDKATMTVWLNGQNITGFQDGTCTNGYDATNGHWWAWVGASNDGTHVTFKITYTADDVERTFEATIW